MAQSPDKTGQAKAVAVGRLTDMVAASPETSFSASFPRETLVKIGVLLVLMILLHYRQVNWLRLKWSSDMNWEHGFIIPLFSLYLVFARREELYDAKRRICRLGLAILIIGIATEILAVFPIRNYWLRDMGMIAAIFGLVLYLGGPGVTRILWVPIVFLIFAMPLPDRVYQMISLPLQNIAAKGATVVLRAVGVDIVSKASALELISRSGLLKKLTVAEACSGMRLLMAFPALGVAMAYLDAKPVWQRLTLVLAALPIAIACNVLRVVITCSMFYFDKPELGQKLMHTITGLAMLLPALLMLWLLGWLLRKLVADDEEAGPADEQDAPASPSPAGGDS